MTTAPTNPTPAPGPGSGSGSHTKQFKPYFTPSQVERLSAKQRGKLSVSRAERGRQQACGFIDAVGVRCGFPRRTIATAQTLYMRFHLFFPYKDFNYVEVSTSCLYVSSKLHDTLKKPREIVLSSYAIRFPHLVRKGALDPAAAEANGLEHDRKQVLSIERLILETMCFKFGVDVGLRAVVKLGKRLGLDKTFCQHAWRVAVDCYRTPAPLSYPPHVIALGSIYTASLLLLESGKVETASDGNDPSAEDDAARMARMLGSNGRWELDCSATAGHVDEVAHALIDLYTTILSLPSDAAAAGGIHTPSPASPKEPAQTSSTQSSASSGTLINNTAFVLPGYWTTQTLTELKIRLRDKGPTKPPVAAVGWTAVDLDDGDDSALAQAVEGMGKNDGTVRFLWDIS